ncbi:MAG TPA: hypothetical protein VMU08_04980 [Rhizomicrobium sp.]|nr:hypothetical protein [Rhizomicrobium sp.]
MCGTTTWRYFVLDHLGSTAAVTDGSGAVIERDAYDPWGKRRNLDGSDDTSCALLSTALRGYTGHEHIDAPTGRMRFEEKLRRGWRTG